MIQPGVYNIKLQRNADYSVELQFMDSGETAIDLTLWTVAAQVWDTSRTNKFADFIVEYLDRPNGRVKLKLPFSVTATFVRELTYDVLLVNPDGEREYYLEGTVTASEGYTVI